MGLIFKTAVAVAVVVVIIAAGFVFYEVSRGSGALTKAQAVSWVKGDIGQYYPSAQVVVLNVSNSTSQRGSWNILTRVTYNQSTACPSVFAEQFDYPAFVFSTATFPYSNYSNGVCRVNLNAGLGTNRTNIIALPALAIAMVYNESYAPLLAYIGSYGFKNVYASAVYVNGSTAANVLCKGAKASACPYSSNESELWLINYTAVNTSSGSLPVWSVVIDSSGRII